MANIGNLSDAVSRFITRKPEVAKPKAPAKRVETRQADNIPSAQKAKVARRQEEAQKSQDSSDAQVPAIEKKKEQVESMSLEDFAEMLRKVNLTFDLFEIQARFTVDQKSGDIQVQVINQRTGEVIRKIPPYEVPGLAEALKKGEAALTDILV